MRPESVAPYPVPDVRLPKEIQRRVGRKTFSAQHGFGVYGPLRRTDTQPPIRNVDFGCRQGIRLVLVRVCNRRRGRTRRRTKLEFGTRQVRIRRLLEVEITLPLPSSID